MRLILLFLNTLAIIEDDYKEKLVIVWFITGFSFFYLGWT